MSRDDLCYLAGLIDGEGTIGLCPSGKFRQPFISMSSTTPELIRFLRVRIGGAVCRQKLQSPRHSKSWSWRLRGDKALSLMRQLLPYLREPNKAARAEVMVARHKTVTPRNGKYTASMLASKRAYEAQVLMLCSRHDR